MTINYQRNPPCVCGIFSLFRPGPVVMLSRRVQVCKKRNLLPAGRLATLRFASWMEPAAGQAGSS